MGVGRTAREAARTAVSRPRLGMGPVLWSTAVGTGIDMTIVARIGTVTGLSSSGGSCWRWTQRARVGVRLRAPVYGYRYGYRPYHGYGTIAVGGHRYGGGHSRPSYGRR